MPGKVEIAMLPAAAAEDERLVAEIAELINQVYAVAEEGLWVDGAARTSAADVADLIAAEQIAVARETNGPVVGSVRIQQLDDDTGEFGMLTAHPSRRSEGLGRELVTFAERLCAERGRRIMQLELLVPRGWTHPSKEFLHAWYSRIGYQPVRKGLIEEDYPQLAPLLATPCDFVVYHKPLTAPSG